MKEWLKRHLRHKEIGWKEYDEDFVRYQLLKCRWFNLYLHRVDAPKWQPLCHDHPWWFLTWLIWPGYLEQVGPRVHRRWPCMFLYRPADFAHNVMTNFGPSWSLVLTGPKSRQWVHLECHRKGEGANESHMAHQ